MPSKNIIKIFAPEQYYHVYNRGVGKQVIYHDDEDFSVFLNLLKRYLDIEPHKDKKGREYEHLRDQVELLAYCLMPNHFHALVYIHDEQAMTKLLRAVCGAYTVYYNKKYDRVGHLFQGAYKASRIDDDAYLQHISRYIHINPKDYKSWPWSSLSAYQGKKQIDWVQPNRITELFNGPSEYMDFLSDYEGYKISLDELKGQLADS